MFRSNKEQYSSSKILSGYFTLPSSRTDGNIEVMDLVTESCFLNDSIINTFLTFSK